jgi:Carboxypeptidase regulatory-like domain
MTIRAGVAAACVISMTVVLPARAPQNAGEIRGRITDWDDGPVAGADIQIRMFDRMPLLRTRSASDGTFRVTNLRPGGYRVIARHDRFGVAIGEDIWLLPGATVAAYTAGRLELLSTSPTAAGRSQLLFRIHHGADGQTAVA